MKNLFKIFAAGVVVLSAALSCTKEQVAPEATQVTLNFVAGNELVGNTKTELGADGKTVLWGEHEQLMVVETIDNAAPATENESEEAVVSADKTIATFAVSLTANNTGAEYVYNAVYPLSSWYGGSGTNWSAEKVKLGVPYEQTPSLTSFDPKADLLVSRPVKTTSQLNNDLSLEFTRLVALGKMKITGLGESEKVSEIKLTATGKVLAGRSYVDLTTGKVIEYGYSTQGKDNVVLKYDESLVFTNGDVAYFTCFPTEFTEGDKFTVVVSTESNIYTKEVTLAAGQSLQFVEGKSSSFTMDMSTATIEPIVAVTTEGAGTLDDPYTAADANALVNAGENTSDVVYVSGIISSIKQISTQYGNATYSISADGTTTDQFDIYRGQYLDGDSFTSEDQLAKGMKVVVKGVLSAYNGTPQLASGSSIVSIAPIIVVKNREISVGAAVTSASIPFTPYSLTGVVTASVKDGGTMANVSASVVSNEVEVTFDANNDASPKTATVVISSEGAENVEVVITQGAAGAKADIVITVDWATNVGNLGTSGVTSSFTIDGYSYKASGASCYYYSNGKAVFLGKTGAYIELPAIEGYKLVNVVLSSSQSTGAANVAIKDASDAVISGGDAVTFKNSNPTDYTFDLPSTIANTSYRITVTNNKNAHIAKWVLTYKAD